MQLQSEAGIIGVVVLLVHRSVCDGCATVFRFVLLQRLQHVAFNSCPCCIGWMCCLMIMLHMMV